jgi:hypothetical protein
MNRRLGRNRGRTSAWASGPAAPISPPFFYSHFVSNGQSLDCGFAQTTVLSTTETLGNKALHDSSETYDITLPSAGTLSIGSSAAPIRTTNAGVNPYPQNISGEIWHSRCADQLTTSALAANYSAMTTVQSCCSEGSQNMSVIRKGGTGNQYAAGIYEVHAIHNLAVAASKTHGVPWVVLTHGEADAGLISVSSYSASLVTMQSDYQGDIQAITTQGTLPCYPQFGANAIPLLLSQQHSEPGLCTGENTTAIAMLNSAQNSAAANPIVMVGPKYQFTHGADNIHLLNTSYQLHGEKMAQAMLTLVGGVSWQPFAPSGPGSAFAVDAVMTVPCNVPVGPIVHDNVHFAQDPFQAGMFAAACATSGGFVVVDQLLIGGVASVTNAAPPVVTMTNPLPASFVTGTVVAMWNVTMATAGATAAVTGIFTVTVTGASSFSLNGVAAPGAAGGSSPQAVIGQLPTISSAVASGSSIVLTCNRTLVGTAAVYYAQLPDFTQTMFSAAGGYASGHGRYGTWRDSDPFTGISGTNQPNWLCAFTQTMLIPLITSASSVLPAGGVTSVIGTGFVTGCTCTIDQGGAKTSCAVTFVSATQLSVTIPAETVGVYNLIVTNPTQNPSTSGSSGTGVLTVTSSLSPPTITSVVVNMGSAAGGQTVTINGTNLTSATITIDGNFCTGVGGSAVQIVGTVPAYSGGANGSTVGKTITVANGGGSANSSGVLQNYYYLPSNTAPIMLCRGDAGVTLATGVSAWADQTTNGNNWAQATGAKQPAQVSNYNGSGIPALSFTSASSQCMTNTFVSPISAGIATYFWVGDTTGPAGDVAFSLGGASNTKWLFTQVSGGHWFQGNGSTSIDLGATNANSHVFSGYNSATTAKAFVDATGTTGTVTAPTAFSGVNVLGAFNSPQSNFITAKIACVLVYPAQISAADITTVQTILKAIFGTP